jgi:hypothetical protein
MNRNHRPGIFIKFHNFVPYCTSRNLRRYIPDVAEKELIGLPTRCVQDASIGYWKGKQQ